MQEQRRIKVTIDPMGNPVVEAVGFNGQGCTEATKGIEQALAGANATVEREFKPEWANYGTTEEGEHEKVSW